MTTDPELSPTETCYRDLMQKDYTSMAEREASRFLAAFALGAAVSLMFFAANEDGPGAFFWLGLIVAGVGIVIVIALACTAKPEGRATRQVHLRKLEHQMSLESTAQAPRAESTSNA